MAQPNAYRFVDRWFIPHPVEEVWEAIVDAEAFTGWWGDVYDAIIPLNELAGDEEGARSMVFAHGRLPYQLRFEAEITRVNRPHVLALKAEGDLTGTGVWRLAEAPGGTRVTYEWIVSADKPLLRTLSPVLKPLFEWNHRWTMRRGEAGLKRLLVGQWHPKVHPGSEESGSVLEISESVEIWRPVAEVFAFLSDLTQERRWQPDIVDVRWTSEGPPGRGSTLREVRKVMGRAATWEFEVTEFEPGQRFCIRSTSGPLPLSSCRLFEAIHAGTRVTQSTRVVLNGVYRYFAPLSGPIAARQLKREMATLKKILERG